MKIILNKKFNFHPLFFTPFDNIKFIQINKKNINTLVNCNSSSNKNLILNLFNFLFFF